MERYLRAHARRDSGDFAHARVWLVGGCRALGARPTDGSRLALRLGTRLEAEIPLDAITAAEPM